MYSIIVLQIFTFVLSHYCTVSAFFIVKSLDANPRCLKETRIRRKIGTRRSLSYIKQSRSPLCSLQERSETSITLDKPINKKKTKKKQKKKSKSFKQEEQPQISDVDHRVLQSILQDNILGLRNEENIKKMLDMQTVPEASLYDKRQSKTIIEDNESEYSSTFFKKMEWNAFFAKAEEIIESTKIFLSNRIERDSKLLASVGAFVLERSIINVERALPSSGKSGERMARKMKIARYRLNKNSLLKDSSGDKRFLLRRSSDVIGIKKTETYDELNTALDEVKAVTEGIRDILSGKGMSSYSSDSRSLKSVAPAGISQVTSRQRKAYTNRKEILKREKEGIDAKIGRTASTITDVAWEIKREMEVEQNKPGYRSKSIRNTIEGTANAAISASREIPKTIHRKRKKEMPQLPRVPAKDEFQITIADLTKERSRLVEALCLCLEQPDKTWLTPEILSPSTIEKDSTIEVDDDAMKEAITFMILVRDEFRVEINPEDFASNQALISELKKIQNKLKKICSLANATAGDSAAEQLEIHLFGKGIEDKNILLNWLDNTLVANEKDLGETEYGWDEDDKALSEGGNEMTSLYNKQGDKEWFTNEDKALDIEHESLFFAHQTSSTESAEEEGAHDLETSYIATNNIETVVVPILPTEYEQPQKPMSNINNVMLIDAEFETESSQTKSDDYFDDILFDDDNLATVEVLTNFDETDINIRSMTNVDLDDSDRKQKDSFIVDTSLRTLDVLFFVVEKTITDVVPGVYTSSKNVIKNSRKVRRSGNGKEGWEMLENIKERRKSY